MVAPDEKTYAYLKGRPKSPKGAHGMRRVRYWDSLRSDDGAHFDHVLKLDAQKLPPLVTWGTSPEDVVSITGVVPNPDDIADEHKRHSKKKALEYIGLTAGHEDHRHCARQGVHRLVHQRPHRRSARGRARG